VLLVLAILFYIVYDACSTVIAFRYLGSFEYETSGLLHAAYDLWGLWGFVLVKSAVSALALTVAYFLAYNGFEGVGCGVMAGAAITGLYAGTSNLNIVLNNGSIVLLGLDAATVCRLLVASCALAGALSDLSGRLRSGRPS
jgi:hypothetical protein